MPAPQSKKKPILIAGIFVFGLATVLAVLYFFFIPELGSVAGFSVGPPPNDPQARKQWLSENIQPLSKTVIVLDEKLPSWKELDQLNESLTAKETYPDFIKATQTYGTEANLVEVLYFGDELKDLGVNTEFIHANYWFRNGAFKLWYFDYDKPTTLSQDGAKRALVNNILLAKQQGLSVVLFPDYFQLENGGMTELNVSDDLEERLETIALELAQIAETYNVEYLVPSNQIEMILFSNGYSVQEAQERTNAFYAQVVPKIRQIYSGKIMYKMGGFGDWSNYDGVSLEGADIFGFTGCYYKKNHDPEFIKTDVKLASKEAHKLSQKYGIPWINAEFQISDEEIPGAQEAAKIYPIEEYYKAGLGAFDQYSYSVGAKGFTVHSLLLHGKVYDTPAIPLIKEFFAAKE